ncbi:MAG: DNA polymerase III subunit gamma/tau [Oscillospiraceae bacterium]|jgi:DNA polymerase-3 subunit gamma/tau|nr:DNA polymerase III subunit gamma/tau [Oscillospiraceae bacterium]
MYEVLYNKYRPKRFEDVIAQPLITSSLKAQVQSGRLSHAYVFTGPAGTGKTTCARILAKAVNCLAPIDGDPCGECAGCVAIDEGSATDVSERDAATNNSVDDVRALREEIGYSPTTLKKRVYIIDEAHMLSRDAWGAFLKILEEPPEHVVFILATTEIQKIPATIMSRCQQHAFRRVSESDCAAHLQTIALREGLTLDNTAALLAAKFSGGGMRDALRLLDSCATTTKDITADIVRSAAGAASDEHLLSLAKLMAANDYANADRLFAKLYADSRNVRTLFEGIINFFRELLLSKCGAGEPLTPEGQDAAALLDESRLLLALDTTGEYYDKLTRPGANERIIGSLLFISLCRVAVPKAVAVPQAVASKSKAQVIAPQPKAQAATFPEPPPLDLPFDIPPPSEPVAAEPPPVPAAPTGQPTYSHPILPLLGNFMAAFLKNATFTLAEHTLFVDGDENALSILKDANNLKVFKSAAMQLYGFEADVRPGKADTNHEVIPQPEPTKTKTQIFLDRAASLGAQIKYK